MTNPRLHRLTALLLAAVMAASVLVSCSGGSTTTEKETGAVNEGTETVLDTTPAVTDRSQAKDSLPEKKYNGKEFHSLIRSEWLYEFVSEEQTGETINDAIYDRNKNVEDRFDVKLKFIDMKGGWNDRNTFNAAIEGEVKSGSGAYDMIAGYQAYIITPAMNGYLHNIYSMPHLEMSQPWWSEKCNQSITVNDRLFLTTGDISLTFWNNIFCFLFNKQVAKDSQIGDIYGMVRDGKWTLDALTEISSKVSRDLNGDGVYDKNDFFGFITYTNNHSRAWMVACETPLTRLNAQKEMEACFNNAHTLEVLDKLFKLYYQNSSYIKGTELNEPNASTLPQIFVEDRALFSAGYLGNTETLREMDSDFGIIPMPKYDEAQQEYHTTVHNSVSMICFPITTPDKDFSGMIAEGMCSESYRTVVEGFYDVCLKSRNSRDEESAEMIDMIRDSVMFDFGWVHSVPMSSIGTIFETLLNANNTNFASYWASKESEVLKGIDTINNAYLKIELD